MKPYIVIAIVVAIALASAHLYFTEPPPEEPIFPVVEVFELPYIQDGYVPDTNIICNNNIITSQLYGAIEMGSKVIIGPGTCILTPYWCIYTKHPKCGTYSPSRPNPYPPVSIQGSRTERTRIEMQGYGNSFDLEIR